MKKKTIVFLSVYGLGILFLGVAIALLKRANLGVPPWDTANFNLQTWLASLDITITLGMSSLIHTSFLLLLVLLMSRSLKTFFAIIPMLLISLSIDFFDLIVFASLEVMVDMVFLQSVYFVIGTLIMTLGLAMIIISGFPPNVYDGFHLTLLTFFKIKSFTAGRLIVEFSGIGLGIIYALLTPTQGLGSVTLLSIALAAIFGSLINMYISIFKAFKFTNRDV
jgi:uncharacterized membrane protein YczE